MNTARAIDGKDNVIIDFSTLWSIKKYRIFGVLSVKKKCCQVTAQHHNRMIRCQSEHASLPSKNNERGKKTVCPCEENRSALIVLRVDLPAGHGGGCLRRVAASCSRCSGPR